MYSLGRVNNLEKHVVNCGMLEWFLFSVLNCFLILCLKLLYLFSYQYLFAFFCLTLKGYNSDKAC